MRTTEQRPLLRLVSSGGESVDDGPTREAGRLSEAGVERALVDFLTDLRDSVEPGCGLVQDLDAWAARVELRLLARGEA